MCAILQPAYVFARHTPDDLMSRRDVSTHSRPLHHRRHNANAGWPRAPLRVFIERFLKADVLARVGS